MGTFSVTIEVGDPQGQVYETVEALVDTGASYTMLPSALLQRLGVRSTETWRFEVADDYTVEYPIGQTWIRLDGRDRMRVVVFGDSSKALLGADTLEGFGLAVDPVRKRLVRVHGLLM